MEKYIKEVNEIIDKYNLSKQEKELFWYIIYPIFEHEEFQKRMDPEKYPHHGKTSLGHHIISDAIVSFIIAKRKIKKGDNVNQELATIIAMFHDLYELPWQNMKIDKKMFVNKHGFTHPIEGSINAATWYPEYFMDEENAKKIIDGVVHHMYPFPVRALDDTDPELHNEEKFKKLPNNIRNLIINTSLKGKVGNVSFCKSEYKEGRIVSIADKIVATSKENTSFNGFKAYITGINPDLNNYEEKNKRSL